MVQASTNYATDNTNPTPVVLSYPLPVLIPSGITELTDLYIHEIDLTSTPVGTLYVVNTLVIEPTSNTNLSTVVFKYPPTLPSGFYVYLKNPGNARVTVYAIPQETTSYWLDGFPPPTDETIPLIPKINETNGYGPSVIYPPFETSPGVPKANATTSYIFWNGTTLNMA